ncbi:hypothetical protein KAR10_09175 [bacterium]|nr:hypothetical protein [bacterium]
MQSMIVENAGTAETGQDIQRLKLWHKTGGSSSGITFDPLTANYLADFTTTGARLWALGFADQEVMVEDGDALYITADISGGARANRTCCFALPALSVKFKYPNNLPESGIVSNTQQVIAQSVSFYVDFTSLAPVNIAEGQKAVCLGRIKISNATGNEIPVSSILVGLTDRAGIAQGLESVFDRIWIERQGDRLAELQAPFSGGNFNLLPQLNLDQDEVVLELGGSIKAAPKVRTFFVGLMHGECLNNGTKLAAAISGKEFPLLTEQINIRGRELKATFSNYPNPFAAGSEGTRISYYLRSQARVEMDVLTLNGDQIKRLADCSQDEGMHETSWDGRNEKGYGVRNGIYLLRIIVNYVNGGKELLVRKVAVAR